MRFRAGTYIGWVGQQNLGDEAMWEVCRTRFPRLSWSIFHERPRPARLVRVLGASARGGRHLLDLLTEEVRHQRRLRRAAQDVWWRAARRWAGEVGMLGGGTLITLSDVWLDSYRALRRRTRSPVPTFGTGVASPEFWSTHQPGWIDRRKEWVALLEDLPLVGVRGPLSKAWLEEAGAKNVVVCGDPAVRFHVPLEALPRAEGPPGSLRIALNCGTSPCPMWGDQDALHRTLAQVALALQQAGHEVELVAVWPEDIAWCARVARDAGLSPSAVVPLAASPDVFLATIERADLLVALKLHAAILAAARNVPVLILEYQPKCGDFAASLDWQRFSIRTSEASSERILSVASSMMAQLPQLREILCRQMCDLAATFDHYCDAIEPLLTGSAATLRGT